MIGLIVVVVSALIAGLLPSGWLPQSLEVPFVAGGWGMRLILFALLVSLWLSIDRAYVLAKSSLDSRSFMEKLRRLVGAGDIAGAAQHCEATDKPLSRIVGAGLAKAGIGEEAVLKAMDEVAFAELPEIEKRTGYLALMGNVATLMGLFGTIVGLIHSFGAVGQAKDVGDKATQLAAGISEAMNCTFFGLMTGIFALAVFSALNGKTQRLLDEINLLSLRAFRLWKKRHGVLSAGSHALVAPAPHLLAHAGLKKAGHHGSHKGRRSTFATLQLTPLIDMFIVLVIFLLISFSSTGEIGAVNQDIKLPFAEQGDEIKRALYVAISYPEGDPSGGVIVLEGAEVATARELLADDGPDQDWRISALTEQLEVHKNNWKLTNKGEDFPGELILQVDQNVDFRIVKKVMYSAGMAGYGRLLLAVTPKGVEGSGFPE